MPVKRASVYADTFDKPQTTIYKLVSGSQQPEQPGAEGEQPVKASQARVHKPTSFYLDDETLKRLDKLAYEYNQQTGKRINRNHIIRYLAGQVELGELLRADLKTY